MVIDSKEFDDIAAFSDPFTEPKISNTKGLCRIEIFRNSRKLAYEIHKESGRITAKHRDRSYPSLRSLLASDEFANIDRFVETQKRFFSKRHKTQEIPSCIKLDDEPANIMDIAGLFQVETARTRLILLDGPAGAGKTFTIEQIARLQIERWEKGATCPPVLHITSRGRRLSNFRDVLAATTQDMGASFSARHVPILVRHSLIVAAIDGFDELVDADGYDDAWSALREFVGDVAGGGTVVLAARDTFVEQHELLKRINGSTGDAVELLMGHIKPIRALDAKEWLSKAPHWKQSDIESSITSEILFDGSYALRPFFLRILADAGGWGNVVQSGLRTYLISNLILRESKLIAQQLGGVTTELVAPALLSLFQEIALEMASRETDSIEVDHLGFLTRYCFDDILDETSIRKLMHKAGSFSLLEPSWTKDKRSFPHSEVRHYFLGSSLIKSLESHTIPIVLRRSALTGEHLEVFAEVFSNDEARAARAAQFLTLAVDGELTDDSLATNGGAILVLAFSLGLVSRLDYITAIDAVFAGDAPSGEFVESQISRMDVVGADISRVRFQNVRVGTLVVDNSTVFGDSLPIVSAIEVRESGRSFIERDPQKISEFMIARRFVGDPEFAKSEIVALLDRVARRAVRYFYLRQQGDDDIGAILLNDPSWQQVRGVLDKHHRIEIKKGKAMHGRPSPLIRIINPKKLLDYSDADTIRILRELVAIESGN